MVGIPVCFRQTSWWQKYRIFSHLLSHTIRLHFHFRLSLACLSPSLASLQKVCVGTLTHCNALWCVVRRYVELFWHTTVFSMGTWYSPRTHYDFLSGSEPMCNNRQSQQLYKGVPSATGTGDWHIWQSRDFSTKRQNMLQCVATCCITLDRTVGPRLGQKCFKDVCTAQIFLKRMYWSDQR